MFATKFSWRHHSQRYAHRHVVSRWRDIGRLGTRPSVVDSHKITILYGPPKFRRTAYVSYSCHLSPRGDHAVTGNAFAARHGSKIGARLFPLAGDSRRTHYVLPLRGNSSVLSYMLSDASCLNYGMTRDAHRCRNK